MARKNGAGNFVITVTEYNNLYDTLMGTSDAGMLRSSLVGRCFTGLWN